MAPTGVVVPAEPLIVLPQQDFLATEITGYYLLATPLSDDPRWLNAEDRAWLRVRVHSR